MYHCQICGGMLERLGHGGCGGRGSVYGCPNCDRLFKQTSGGIIATPGGETLSPTSGSYREYKGTQGAQERG